MQMCVNMCVCAHTHAYVEARGRCLVQFLSTLFFESGYLIDSGTHQFSWAALASDLPAPPVSPNPMSFHSTVESHTNLKAVRCKYSKGALISFPLNVT